MPELKTIVRNEHGLIEGIDYKFNESGLVDWRAMIPEKFLVFNTQYAEQIQAAYGKPLEELKVSEVEDKYLLILLGGIKELARLRGFNVVSYKIVPASERCITASCEIEWLPNFETEGRTITFSDAADASIANTSGFGNQFLTTIAANRSFIRNTKNFLGINILGHDEIADKTQKELPEAETVTDTSPHGKLQKLLDEKGASFEKLKANALKTDPSAESWTCLKDIPLLKVLEIIGQIQNKNKQK